MVFLAGCAMKRRIHPYNSLFFVIFIFYIIWVGLLILAPFMIPAGAMSDLSGVVGYSDNGEIINGLSFPWNGIYSLGDILCHQKAERSLFLNGNEMPFCSRCTAIWLGIAIGLGIMVFFTIDLNEKFFLAIIASFVPLGVDGVGQMLGFWESTNVIRMLTGFPAGVVCGVALGIIFDEIRSLHIFKKIEST
jgi:uncharacterized membrane protein